MSGIYDEFQAEQVDPLTGEPIVPAVQPAEVAPAVAPVAPLATAGLYDTGVNTAVPGLGLEQTQQPVVEPVVSSNATAKKLRNGNVALTPSAEPVEQTVTAPTSTSSSVRVAESRAGTDEATYQKRVAEGKQTVKGDLGNIKKAETALVGAQEEQAALEQKALADSVAIQNAASDEIQKIQTGQYNMVENARLQMESIHAIAKAETEVKMRQWEAERQQLATLINRDPVVDLYSGVGGLGMIFTKAVGTYLTAMGVNNDLGAQMDQWANRAIELHKSRVQGKKDLMSATETAIDRIWKTSASEREAKLKTTQMGLQALDTKIEIEKQKTSSKLRIAQLSAQQAGIRTQMLETQYKLYTETAKTNAGVRLQTAQTAAAYAQASHTKTMTSIAQAEHLRKMAAIPPPPELKGAIKVMLPDGKFVYKRILEGVEGSATATAVRESLLNFSNVQALSNDLVQRWRQSGTQSTFQQWVGEDPEAQAIVRNLALAQGKLLFGTLTDKDRSSVAGASGLVSEQSFVDLGMGAIKRAFGGAEPMKVQEVFVRNLAESAARDYSTIVRSHTREYTDHEKAYYKLDEVLAAEDKAAQTQSGDYMQPLQIERGNSMRQQRLDTIGKLEATVFNADPEDQPAAINRILSVGHEASRDIQMLTERLARLQPGSIEYNQTQEMIKQNNEVLLATRNSLSGFLDPEQVRSRFVDKNKRTPLPGSYMPAVEAAKSALSTLTPQQAPEPVAFEDLGSRSLLGR